MQQAWLDTHRTVIHQWMCDHFGHLNVRYYAHLFDDASFAMWSMAGATQALFGAAGLHTVVARTETEMLAELLPGTVVEVRSRFIAVGTKSVTYEQVLYGVESQTAHARQRAVEVFFDPQTRRSAPIPPAIRVILEKVVVAGASPDEAR